MPAFLALHSTDNGLAGSPTESNVAVDSMQAISGWVDVLSQRSLSRAAQVIVEHLAHVTEARTVVLGRWNPVRETTDVLAISATKGWDPRSERLQQYRAAFDECLIRGQSTRWPGRDENDANSSLILQRLAEGVGCGSIDCLPLSEEGGRPHYMAIVLGNRVIGENSEPLIAAYAPLVSPALKLHQRAEGRGVRGIVDDCRSGFALRRNRLILVACVALLAGLFVPVPHTIRGDCVTQPVARRFVAAPFAGTLKTVHVQLGERVEPGQVLALMD
ncbi:MAG: biotin/lipoyl-binding protein, partial [Planctomycetaceae bacterium]